jgi:putative protein kinase ArgK-like GTPase of G3E family
MKAGSWEGAVRWSQDWSGAADAAAIADVLPEVQEARVAKDSEFKARWMWAAKRGPKRTLGITGPSGSGKSVTLLYAAAYAREQNWLVL